MSILHTTLIRGLLSAGAVGGAASVAPPDHSVELALIGFASALVVAVITAVAGLVQRRRSEGVETVSMDRHTHALIELEEQRDLVAKLRVELAERKTL